MKLERFYFMMTGTLLLLSLFQCESTNEERLNLLDLPTLKYRNPVADPDRCHGFQETCENCPHKFNIIYKFCS